MSLFLIDLGTPVVFIHIPKTGGTSIRKGRQESSFRLFAPDPTWGQHPALAFMRDPFSRIESCWRDFRFIRPQTDLGFEAFVKWVNRPGIGDRIESPSTVEHHAAPMTHPVHGLQHASFIGRFEHLQQDLDHFCVATGVPSVELPHHRAAGNAPRAERAASAVGLVRDLYATDYDYLETLP